ncbi:MAG: molybdopterin-dependent oxidoreductase [Deltaproteobacteria bacterium]|nr:molybdopterin-dependent oxidoreductase [Deltaproteobacteria bacterium]MBW2070758.1 molybdopterin-dependent oxidoreductase [Deltaproteobacteria bacterium]
MQKDVYSICFMCTVRCPIKVTVVDGAVKWIEGNPYQLKGGLCAKGSAGIQLLYDKERLRYPMIRAGARGEGKWRRVTWDEALDYSAEKLKGIMEKYGPQSIVFGERQNLNTHISKTFMRAIGSPNHYSHDSLCKGSVNTAFRSLTGYTDAQVNMDFANTKHVIFYGRNFFESLQLKPIQAFMKARKKGAKTTYIDIRATVTASKADRFWLIRPGTDLALNYALMHVILKENLYDEEYVSRWVTGLDELRAFVELLTPEWAERETGIPANEIVSLAREVSRDKPQVIFNYGYRGANHTNEIYFRRSIIILNALMGSIEAKGGLYFKKGPKDAGYGSFGKLVDQQGLPKPNIERFDGVGGSRFPICDPAHGVAQMLPLAILSEDPYPIKAVITNRFDPLLSIPDYNLNKRAFNKLDFALTIDINFSETAWYSDVVLPECIYLERADSLQMANSLKPTIFMRRQCVPPRYDTKPQWEIIKGLAERLGLAHYFPYESIEDIWDFQLKDMGIRVDDFDAKGFVSLSDKAILWDRRDGIKFKTPSKKIELVSSLLEDNGFPSFPEYETVKPPEEGSFWLTVGRCAVHTHISTQNNPYLNELVPENALWINSKEAEKLGIGEGQEVEITSTCGTGRIKVHLTEYIHPEAVFMLHGFGRQVPAATRTFDKGASDTLLQENLTDMIGGSPALHETIVRVRPLS